MAKVKIFLDPIANSMNMWWGKPKDAYTSEEVESSYSNDIVIKDKKGVPIGVEKIGFFPQELNLVSIIKRYLSIKKDEPILLEGKQL